MLYFLFVKNWWRLFVEHRIDLHIILFLRLLPFSDVQEYFGFGED